MRVDLGDVDTCELLDEFLDGGREGGLFGLGIILVHVLLEVFEEDFLLGIKGGLEGFPGDLDERVVYSCSNRVWRFYSTAIARTGMPAAMVRAQVGLLDNNKITLTHTPKYLTIDGFESIKLVSMLALAALLNEKIGRNDH